MTERTRGIKKPTAPTPDRAPLVEALWEHANRRSVSLHVPGHKRGAAFAKDPVARTWLGAIGPFDATELPGLDDLHAPIGPIREAQELAAQCFGAEYTYFLVGGSTVGNLAALSAVVGRGELVLMQRNVHKSAIHALVLNGAGAVFMPPRQDPDTGMYTGLTAEDIHQGCAAFPEAKAVFITNPNYYGMSVDVGSIAKAAHAYGKPLIVDEAHGAHFGFHSRFPASALQGGADAVVQSTHKMLPAMTMGAMLHLQGERIDRRAVEQRLGMLQSSSPSYPIMASLDWARRELHTLGAAAFHQGLAAADKLTRAMDPHSGARRFAVVVHAKPETDDAAYTAHDPFKQLIFDRIGELSGYRIQQLLAEFGCFLEMADERYAVCALSAASTEDDAARLLEALDKIDARFPAKKKEIAPNSSNSTPLWQNDLSNPVFIAYNDTLARQIAVERAVGATCAELVVPYPPGIPLLYPGEQITRQAVETLIRLREQGASVQGIRDRTMQCIYVSDRAPSEEPGNNI